MQNYLQKWLQIFQKKYQVMNKTHTSYKQLYLLGS